MVWEESKEPSSSTKGIIGQGTEVGGGSSMAGRGNVKKLINDSKRRLRIGFREDQGRKCFWPRHSG